MILKAAQIPGVLGRIFKHSIPPLGTITQNIAKHSYL
jgi:hypothetical protein